GLVAAAPATPYAARFGPVRRQVLAATVVTFDGERLEWGRAVMKDVAGYDMAGLVCGSRGRLGLVARVSFRVWPRPEVSRLFAPHGAADDGGPAALAGVTAGVDGGRDWGPSAESWSWVAGGPERPPLLVELAGSGPSVEAREERLRTWAREEGLQVERAPADGGQHGVVTDESSGASTLRFRVDPGYVADAAADVVASKAADRVVAHPREGVLRALCGSDAAGVDALEAGVRGVPDASVAVERGPRELHARADGRREPRRVELEDRVLEALGGRPRHWTADFL
ncbi:MAG: FAD-binding oxidoreductase, partial [Gemmatimonadota bacterium]